MSGAALSRQDAKLLTWLDRDPDRFERYLADHPDQADHVEALVERTFALGDHLRAALVQAIDVPLGFAERMQTRTMEAASSTDAASVVLDLFGIGAATASLLLDDTLL